MEAGLLNMSMLSCQFKGASQFTPRLPATSISPSVSTPSQPELLGRITPKPMQTPFTTRSRILWHWDRHRLGSHRREVHRLGSVFGLPVRGTLYRGVISIALRT